MANEWFILRGSKEQGPFTLKMLIEHKDAGTLKPSDEVRESDSFDDWAEAGYVDGLFVTKAHLRKAIRRAGPRPGSPQLRDAWWQEVFSFCEDIEEDYQDIQYDGFEPVMPPTPTERSDVSRPTFNVDKMLDEWMERYEDNPAFAPAPEQIWPNCPPGILNEFRKRLATLMQAQAIMPSSSKDKGKIMEPLDPSLLKKGYRPTTSAYELTERLGRGGFGEVWRAENQRRKRSVAFKFCLDLVASSVASMKNELSKIQELDHTGIVKLEEEHLDAPIPFIQYEFVDGIDLRRYLLGDSDVRSFRPLSLTEATGFILNLAEIIAYVHSLSDPVVHRDLKPANILVSNVRDLNVLAALGVEADIRLATLKVMDFGLASHSRQSMRTGANSIGAQFDGWGTEAYMSPQQRMGDPAHPTDDVFAIGVIWYELLKGEMGSGSPSGIKWHSVCNSKGMSDKQLRVLVDCLEEEREHRIPNAVALVERIREAYKPMEPRSLFEQVRKAISRGADFGNVTSLSVEMAQLVAKEGIGRLSGLNILPVQVAKVLASATSIVELSLDGLESLADDAADALARFLGETLSLAGLTTLTPVAASSLAEWQGRRLSLDGLTKMEAETARALAKTRDKNRLSLWLNGLESLNPKVAECLANGNWELLGLDGVKSISPGIAKALAEFQGKTLVLRGVETLDLDAAGALAKWKGEVLVLDGVKTLTPKMAEALAKWEGQNLSLRGLSQIDPECARSLAGRTGGRLWLDGLTTLAPDVAASLCKWKGELLGLNGVATFSTGTGDAIDNWEVETLCFDSLSMLTPEVLYALSRWQVDTLHLNGLTAIGPEASNAIAEWNVHGLCLDGLKAITPEIADALAHWRGTSLTLNGVKALDYATAMFLVRWNGLFLELGGIDELEMDVAEALAKWEGSCSLVLGVKWLDPEDGRSLARWVGHELLLNELKDITPETAAALATWEGAVLGLISVTTLSFEAAFELAKSDACVVLSGLEPESKTIWERAREGRG